MQGSDLVRGRSGINRLLHEYATIKIFEAVTALTGSALKVRGFLKMSHTELTVGPGGNERAIRGLRRIDTKPGDVPSSTDAHRFDATKYTDHQGLIAKRKHAK